MLTAPSDFNLESKYWYYQRGYEIFGKEAIKYWAVSVVLFALGLVVAYFHSAAIMIIPDMSATFATFWTVISLVSRVRAKNLECILVAKEVMES